MYVINEKLEYNCLWCHPYQVLVPRHTIREGYVVKGNWECLSGSYIYDIDGDRVTRVSQDLFTVFSSTVNHRHSLEHAQV